MADEKSDAVRKFAMSQVFQRIEVYPRVRGGTEILWQLTSLFSAAVPGPYAFTVEVSKSGVGDWEEVGQVVDAYYLQDPAQRLFGKGPRASYRVKVEADGASFCSRIQQVTGNLLGQDAAVYLTLLNKERTLAEKAGRCGWLYKRRHWGTACTACADQFTGGSVDATCATCFGTGFEGGYFDPVPYWISPIQDPAPRRLGKANQVVNTSHDQVRLARGPGCPWVESKDVWVDAQSDQRFIVQSVGQVEFRFVPIAFSPLELRLAEATDIIYTLPRPGD